MDIEKNGKEIITEYFKTPIYLEKLMQIHYMTNFSKVDQYRNIMNKLINNLTECVVKRADIAKRFIRDGKKNDYLPYHSINSSVYSVSCGVEMKLEYDKLLEIALGGILHDVGMIFVPKEIFNKNDPLTKEELFMIQRHPEKGCEVLYDENKNVKDIILKHHERFKGGGYPEGRSFRFSGDKLASIVGIASTYDALTTFRVYKAPKSDREAREILISEKGKSWPEEIIVPFFKGLSRLGF